MNKHLDYITPVVANNLSDLFYERVNRSKNKIAYSYYDDTNEIWKDLSWQDISKKVELWHAAFRHEGLTKGDRVAIMMKNCPDWVVFDQAAYSLGLVVVPIYTNDRAENIRYILEDANVKIFFIEDPTICKALLKDENIEVKELLRVVTHTVTNNYNNSRLVQVDNWLPTYAETIERVDISDSDLATVVYTSGTTGRPKGVMLSHKNIFSNTYAAAIFEQFDTDDIFLSFLPLSHMFERTAGYYMPMLTGSRVAYARSIEKLAEDLITIRPTILVTVPRIFERVYNKIHDQLSKKSSIAQGLFKLAVETGWHRFLLQQKCTHWHPKLLLWPLLKQLVAGKILAKLGGNLQLAISGGAALSPQIAKTFKLKNNDPFSVGEALDNVEIKLSKNNELLVKGPTVMLGYWNNEAATKDVIDTEGWFHTGDKAKIKNNHIYITGRLKEIIVMSNGEKVPPSDIELAITSDSLFEQIIVIGEAKPFLTVIATIEKSKWQDFANTISVSDDVSSLKLEKVTAALLQRMNKQLTNFPGYAKIIRAHIVLQPWDIDSGLITPTLKLKRSKIHEHYQQDIIGLYDGH